VSTASDDTIRHLPYHKKKTVGKRGESSQKGWMVLAVVGGREQNHKQTRLALSKRTALNGTPDQSLHHTRRSSSLSTLLKKILCNPSTNFIIFKFEHTFCITVF
jgi:hypothetical protein